METILKMLSKFNEYFLIVFAAILLVQGWGAFFFYPNELAEPLSIASFVASSFVLYDVKNTRTIDSLIDSHGRLLEESTNIIEEQTKRIAKLQRQLTHEVN